METRTSADSPIRVDYVPREAFGLPEGSGALGMTFAPGMKDLGWDRDVGEDLAVLKNEYWTDILVSLMEDFEYDKYRMGGVQGYFEAAADAEMEVVHFPIVDVDVPREEQVEEYAGLVGRIVGFLREGRNTVVHCRGGIGRTGIVVSSVLVEVGHGAEEAIEIVRQARSRRMVETGPQEDYVREFAKRHQGHWSG